MAKFLTASLIAGGLLCGCSRPESPVPADLISQNDFESLSGWVAAVPPGLTTERAHSGSYAVKVDAGTEFGAGYSTTLADAKLQPGQRLKVSAWALRTSEQTNAALVVQLIDPTTGQQLDWQGLSLVEQIKTYNRWMLLEMQVRIPENAQPHYQLKVYPWRNQAVQAAYFDDIQLRRKN